MVSAWRRGWAHLRGDRLLWASLALFGVHYGAQALGFRHNLLDGYLDPVLSIPVLLGLLEAEQAALLGKRYAGLTWAEALGAAVAIAVLCEWVLPRLWPGRWVGDAWDGVGYAGGLALSLARGRWTDLTVAARRIRTRSDASAGTADPRVAPRPSLASRLSPSRE